MRIQKKISIESCIEDLCTMVRNELDSPRTTLLQRKGLKLIQKLLIKIQVIYITHK